MISDQPTHVAVEGAPALGSPAATPTQHVKLKSSFVARRMRERVVLVSMGLVTAAAAGAMHTLFYFSMPGAILSGAGVWTALVLLHFQTKKNFEIQQLKADIAKLENGRHQLPLPESAQSATRRGQTEKIAATLENNNAFHQSGAPDERHTVAKPAKPMQATQIAVEDGFRAASTGPATHPSWQKSEPRAVQSNQDDKRKEVRAAAIATALWPGTALSATDPMRDQRAFRPKEARITLASTPSEASSGGTLGSLPSSLDADLEMVQRKIKALAEEVNAAELGREIANKSMSMPSAGAALAIEKSVGALKATVDSMRERPANKPPRVSAAQPDLAMSFDLMIPATAQRIAVSEPEMSPILASTAPELPPEFELPPLPGLQFASEPQAVQLSPRLAAISAAIAHGAMDVFLSPIVALQTHQVSHYDVTVRLKSANGTYIDGAEQDLQLAGNDILALFDIARLKRASALAQRLYAHNKAGSLLAAVNGQSLTNGEFLETFAQTYEERDRISAQLVLSFAQADVELFSASAWQALSNMHAFGFRFALTSLDHASMDFAGLAKRGFTFLRVSASALTDGLPARDRFIRSDELCKMLAGAGMTLIADAIDDEAVRARVFGFGVLFGQGRLFGGARQVKLDPLPSVSSAAA